MDWDRVDPMEFVAAAAESGVPLRRLAQDESYGDDPWVTACGACLVGQLLIGRSGSKRARKFHNVDPLADELGLPPDYVMGLSDVFEGEGDCGWCRRWVEDPNWYDAGRNDAEVAIDALKQHGLWPKELD